MKISLDLDNDEIKQLTHTYQKSFLHCQPDRFEMIRTVIHGVNKSTPHSVSEVDPNGDGWLAWIDGESYIFAKIYAEWCAMHQTGHKIFILWDTSEDHNGWVVWSPQETEALR